MKTQFPVLISLLNLNDRGLLSYMYMYIGCYRYIALTIIFFSRQYLQNNPFVF